MKRAGFRARYGIDLQTALRSNMQDSHPKDWVKLLQTVRRLIETVIGQLSVSVARRRHRFNIEKVWARDMWHLTSQINIANCWLTLFVSG